MKLRPGSNPIYKLNETRVVWLTVLLFTGATSLAIRLLLNTKFSTTGLLYVGVPYTIALLLALIRPMEGGSKWWHEYRDFTLTSLIVFLGSSAVLYEGFLCVLFFMPLYFIVVSVVFALHWCGRLWHGYRARHLVTLSPLLFAAMSLEGTTDWLSFERDNSVTVTRSTPLSSSQIRSNLLRPIALDYKGGWLLSIFPVPYEIKNESLETGATHRISMRYHRWFFTNTHEGQLHLRLDEVSDHLIRTRVVHDSTYMAGYLTALGTQLEISEVPTGNTVVSLTLDYHRKLDPAWYFHPLQRIAARQMAEVLLSEVVLRD